jgi:hypothetical protein
LKLLYSIIISTLLLLPSFGNVVIYLTFKVNQDEISKTLCVKKEVKNNTCNGKCYLAKQLKKGAEKEKQESPNLKEKQELVYTQTASNYNFTPIITIEKTRMMVSRYCEKSKSVAVSIFHPPLV